MALALIFALPSLGLAEAVESLNPEAAAEIAEVYAEEAEVEEIAEEAVEEYEETPAEAAEEAPAPAEKAAPELEAEAQAGGVLRK